MPYLMHSIPYFRCFARREYTVDMQRYEGEYIPAIAYAVRCVRGHSLWFQTMLCQPIDGSPNNTGGASFLLPIEALVHSPCAPAGNMTYVQPWDCFSSDFCVTTLDLVSRGATLILPERRPAQYQFTIDFTGSDLADDPDQHKSLHVMWLQGGLIGAFPNNRVLWEDSAFWEVMDEQPDFASLAGEHRAEGNQHIAREHWDHYQQAAQARKDQQHVARRGYDLVVQS